MTAHGEASIEAARRIPMDGSISARRPPSASLPAAALNLRTDYLGTTSITAPMHHTPALISDLGLILSVAAVTTLVFKKIKQPLVLGYIIAGMLVGPNVPLLPSVLDEASIQVWSQLGVIFLLFSLGLEFSFKKVMKVGGSAGITALFTVVFMSVAGWFVGRMLGWSTMDSLFLGGIICMSSTTIIARALDELGLKTQVFAAIVVGMLVIEDVVAVLLMVLLGSLAVSQHFSGPPCFGNWASWASSSSCGSPWAST